MDSSSRRDTGRGGLAPRLVGCDPRIAPPEMLPCIDLLPQLICSPAEFSRGGSPASAPQHLAQDDTRKRETDRATTSIRQPASSAAKPAATSKTDLRARLEKLERPDAKLLKAGGKEHGRTIKDLESQVEQLRRELEAAWATEASAVKALDRLKARDNARRAEQKAAQKESRLTRSPRPTTTSKTAQVVSGASRASAMRTSASRLGWSEPPAPRAVVPASATASGQSSSPRSRARTFGQRCQQTNRPHPLPCIAGGCSFPTRLQLRQLPFSSPSGAIWGVSQPSRCIGLVGGRSACSASLARVTIGR